MDRPDESGQHREGEDRGDSRRLQERVTELEQRLGMAEDERRLFGDLQERLAERKRDAERIEHLSRLYAVLSRVNEAIVRIHEEGPLFREVCRIVAVEGGFPLVWIGRVEDDQVVPVTSCGPSAEYLKEIRVELHGKLSTGPTGTCIREGRSVVNPDFGTNPATSPWRRAALRHDFHASAAFPLFQEGTAIGAITLYAREPDAFDEEQVTLLGALADDLSFALEAMRQERLRKSMEEALRRADRHKDEFLAVLSHELRNPLAPIRNSLFVLAHAAPGSEESTAARAVIDRQVTQLTRLVDDLLDVTRIARGKIRLERTRLDLVDLVRRCGEDHRGTFVAAGIQFESRIPSEPVWLEADGARLVQVVGNLLQNAARFTPEGGRVDLSLESDGTSALLRIRDTGVGIPPQTLGKIFEPFVQAVQGRGGLGLGLALVRGLIELHGGGVCASSEGPGRGAEFTARLPIEEHQEREPAQAAASFEPIRRRVLIIEDNRDSADSLQQVLEVLGHEARVAYTGLAGIALAREFRPEVVLCDIGLPDMDGYAVARALRDDALLGAVELVALTGYAQPEDRMRAAEEGFTSHLAKPVGVEELARLLGASGSSPS